MSSPNPNSLYSSSTGTFSTDVFIAVLAPVNPSGSDINYPVQKRWINTTTYAEYILIGFTSFNGVIQANWIPLSSSSSSALQTLKGNTGAVVPGDTSNNINILGDTTTCTVAGSPSTNTLTISTITTPAQLASFRAEATVNQGNVTGEGTVYTIQFPTVVYNTATTYNAATGIFTAPFAGTYVFNCGVGYSSGDGSAGEGNASYIYGGFLRNSSVYDLGFALPTNKVLSNYQGYEGEVPYYYQNFTAIYRLNAGDTISCSIKGIGTVSKTVDITPVQTAPCFFAGGLI